MSSKYGRMISKQYFFGRWDFDEFFPIRKSTYIHDKETSLRLPKLYIIKQKILLSSIQMYIHHTYPSNINQLLPLCSQKHRLPC